jgi:DNA-binding CsgD family transcriptional regulator
LISIIEKIPNAQIIQQIDSEDEIKTLNHFDPDFIILNPDLLDKKTQKSFLETTSQTSEWIGNSKLISLSNDSKLTNTNWVEFINIEDSQETILTKLKALIGNREPINSTSEGPVISKREVDILKNIALGLSNKEIADKLFISTHTVVTHRKNITRKLGIKTVPGLTIYAILNKIININETE